MLRVTQIRRPLVVVVNTHAHKSLIDLLYKNMLVNCLRMFVSTPLRTLGFLVY